MEFWEGPEGERSEIDVTVVVFLLASIRILIVEAGSCESMIKSEFAIVRIPATK